MRRIGELMGRRFEEIAETVEERLGQDSRYRLDCRKAERELGWSPEISFDDGVRETIDWINGAWEQIAHEPLDYVHKV